MDSLTIKYMTFLAKNFDLVKKNSKKFSFKISMFFYIFIKNSLSQGDKYNSLHMITTIEPP